MNSTYTAYTSADAYTAGYTCDGYPKIAEYFYVTIENETGRRYRHEASFRSVKSAYCEETGESFFEVMHAEAFAKAERLAERVNAALAAGAALDPTLWREVDPAYGSQEYQSQGIEAQRALADRLAD